MKCINCGTNNNLKERTENAGVCKNCEHPFSFEPQELPPDLKLTDTIFAKTIADVSANQTLFFTPGQLHYLLDKQLRAHFSKRNIVANQVSTLVAGLLIIITIAIAICNSLHTFGDPIVAIVFSCYAIWVIQKAAQSTTSGRINRQIRLQNIANLKLIAIAIIVCGLPASIVAQTIVGMVCSVSIGLWGIGLSYYLKQQQSKIVDCLLVEKKQFETWLDTWTSINNAPMRMLEIPETASSQLAPKSDLIAYSFDRVVVCDSPKIANMLIRNNFHFENNCAVLSIDRYPHNTFQPMMEMLNRNPDLKVYAFHDFSPRGIKMIRHLRSEKIWFPNPAIPIIDVGIRLQQIMDNSDLITLKSDLVAEDARELPTQIRTSLDPTELAWLDHGYYLELESFPPQKIVQILQRAISENPLFATIDRGEMVNTDRNPDRNPDLYPVESLN